MFNPSIRSGAALICATLFLSACSRPAPTEEPVRSVKLVTVSLGNMGSSAEFAGEVRARVESRLGFRVAGKLVRRQAEPGQRVRAGDVLAQLDPQDYQLAADAGRAQVSAAATNRDLAAADFKRDAHESNSTCVVGARTRGVCVHASFAEVLPESYGNESHLRPMDADAWSCERSAGSGARWAGITMNLAEIASVLQNPWLMYPAFVAAAQPLALAIVNMRRYAPAPALREIAEKTRLIRVAVCVPARNERENIEACLRSVLSSIEVDVRAYVYDDESSDGTDEIVARLAAEDARVIVVARRPLPAHWNGKQHACSRMAMHALAYDPKIDWFLFTDADVRFEPDAVARALGFALSGGSIPRRALLAGSSFWFRARPIRRAADTRASEHRCTTA